MDILILPYEQGKSSVLKAERKPAAHVEPGAGAVAMARLDKKVNCTVPSPTPRQKRRKKVPWKGTKFNLP